jgi:hypothetical protein
MKIKQDARRALHLFSGPANRIDGISAILREIGWDCDDIDICNASPEDNGSNDLLNDANWISIQSSLRQGKYTVVFMGTPCNTFSRLRSHSGGPPPLRSKRTPTRIAQGRVNYQRLRLPYLRELFRGKIFGDSNSLLQPRYCMGHRKPTTLGRHG